MALRSYSFLAGMLGHKEDEQYYLESAAAP